MKYRRIYPVLLFLLVVLITVLFAMSVHAVENITNSSENDLFDEKRTNDWGIATSGYVYGHDGVIYPYSCALVFAEEKETNVEGEVHCFYAVSSYLNLEYNSHALVLGAFSHELEAVIYIPEIDEYISKTNVTGGDSPPIDANRNLISNEVVYKGQTYSGEIVSVIAKYYISGRQIDALSWSKIS